MALNVQLDNLAIGYRHGRTVASAINVEFRSGELSCLIGANGTGKSTLLKTISGYLKPKAGCVWLHGEEGRRSVAAMSSHELARSIGIVLSKAPDVSNLTVEEMVGMGRSPYTSFWGSLSATDRSVVGRSIEAVGIQELTGRMIQTLSDGERQKVMIARALAQQTPVMLLDEPTAFLDYQSKAELMGLLRKLARDGNRTIVLSTHDLSLAVRLADRLFRLSDGSLCQVDREDVQASMDNLLKDGDR